MQIQLKANASRTRCYECGSPSIGGICHHCGRAICQDHVSLRLDNNGRPLTAEFSNLGLENTCKEAPIHCRQCDHVVRPTSQVPYWLGASVILFGACLIAAKYFTIGWSLVVVGVVVSGLGLAVNLYRQKELLKARPPLPLVPRFSTIKLEERIHGRIEMDSVGAYHALMAPAQGRLTISANFGEPEREQLLKYRKKYRLQEADEILFHAGFAELCGSAKIEWMSPDCAGDRRSQIVAFRGDVSSEQAFADTDERDSVRWSLTRDYRIIEASSHMRFPIRVIPSIEMETAKRTLYLQVLWHKVAAETKGEIRRIEELKVNFPVEWGEVERISDTSSAVINKGSSNGSESVTTVTWRQISITDAQESKQGRHTFWIRFEKDIDLDSEIAGALKLTFKKTLSGIEMVNLYYPIGAPHRDKDTEVKTTVDGDFKLSLAGLRHQEMRVVPDIKRKEDKDLEATVSYTDVIPDHNTVANLVDMLSNEGFYVKSMVEHAPRMSGRGNTINHVWDIVGRRYLEIFPVDFHVVVSGEEVFEEIGSVAAGNTRVALTVQGGVSSKEMEDKVINVWSQLSHLIGESLRSMVRLTTSDQPGEPRASRSSPWEEDLQPPRPASTEDEPRYRNKVDALMSVLIDSLLPDDLFLELKASIERAVRRVRVGV